MSLFLLERDPGCSKAILYKSKVYNEMPFLQEVYGDTAFVPIATERETYTTEPPSVEPRSHIWVHLAAPTWAAFAAGLLELHARAEVAGQILHPVDTMRMLEKCRVSANSFIPSKDDDTAEMEITTAGPPATEQVAASAAKKELSEADRVQVSVQNLVEEMVDIIVADEQENNELLARDLLDDLLCSMFGVPPKSRAEKVAAGIIDDLLAHVVFVGAASTAPRAAAKKSVIVEPKGARKRGASSSIFDQIPEELIEKRRSSRKTKLLFDGAGGGGGGLLSSDTSNDVTAMMTPVELLTSFLPDSLRVAGGGGSSGGKRVRFNIEESAEVKQKLFADAGGSTGRPPAVNAWFDPDTERQELERFLAAHQDESVWHLLRYFLDYMFR